MTAWEYWCLCFASNAFARVALAGSPSTSSSSRAPASLFVVGATTSEAPGLSVAAPSSLSSAISFNRCCLSEEEDDVLEPLVCDIVLNPSADSDSSSAVVNEKTVSYGTKASRIDWNWTANRTATGQHLGHRFMSNHFTLQKA